jgi:hypothetical protein
MSTSSLSTEADAEGSGRRWALALPLPAAVAVAGAVAVLGAVCVGFWAERLGTAAPAGSGSSSCSDPDSAPGVVVWV